MLALKLARIGNSVGAVFPKEMLTRLHADVGDVLYVTEAPDGVRITPYNPDFARQTGVTEKVMKKRRAVLRELAK